MKLPRRHFLHLSVGAAALLVLPRRAVAVSYPSRPVHIIVGFPPGAASDITARLIGHWLSERLGQQFIVDNRPGANGNIGTEAVARAPADGYTLLMMTSGMASNAALYNNPSFNLIRDIAPVGGVSRIPFVMEVNPSVPATTVPEFIAYARANPGKLNFGSSGNGAGSHLAAELFKSMTGVEMLHVPYRGPAQALTDLIAGRVQVMFDVLTSSIAHIKGHEVRALAITTSMPSEALPGIPTLGEFVPGYEASGWIGVGAPKNTPAEIVNRLNDEINAGLTDPKMKAQLADLGGSPFVDLPAELGKFITDEIDKWGKVIRAANIKPD